MYQVLKNKLQATIVLVIFGFTNGSLLVAGPRCIGS